MNHKSITSSDVNSFVWFNSRKEAIDYVRQLKHEGRTVYYGGKRGRSKGTYHDLKMLAIYHNKWNGSGMPWVVGWFE